MRHKVLWKGNTQLLPPSSDVIAILSSRYRMSTCVLVKTQYGENVEHHVLLKET